MNSIIRSKSLPFLFERTSLLSSYFRSSNLHATLHLSVGNIPSSSLKFSTSSLDGFKFLETHEYAKVDGDIATIGISDFAQSQLGDVVYVELPDVCSNFICVI